MSAVYWQYDELAVTYTGWSLSEIKKLSVRERAFWVGMVRMRRGDG